MNAGSLAPVVDAIMAHRGDVHAPPAALLAIRVDGETHRAAAGIADLGTGESASPAHAQDLASVSKVLTTLALQVLFSRDQVRPHTRLGEVLGGRAGVHAGATLDQLARHRAGLREWWPLYLEPGAADDPVAAALALPPRCAPDTARHYSDLGMQALGDVIATVSGRDFAEAVRELVLDPLGAATVTPGHPAPGLPVLAGPDGDRIEQEMVRSGEPYPVGVDGEGFPWRQHPLTGEVADGNAFHAFHGVAGHAGWFADLDGLLRVAGAIADPGILGITPPVARDLQTAVDEGQARGLRRYTIVWRGRERLVLGHPGFTGAFLGASPAGPDGPELRVALLANRLHGAPAPTRHQLAPVEPLWRDAMAAADTILNPSSTGGRP